jgi:hypothetical protein
VSTQLFSPEPVLAPGAPGNRARRGLSRVGLMGVLLATVAASAVMTGPAAAKGGGGAALVAPPAIFIFPSRSMVDLQNYSPTGQSAVQVEYHGTAAASGMSLARTVLRGTTTPTSLLPLDPNSAGGEVLVNHPANIGMADVCWSSTAPGSSVPSTAFHAGDTIVVKDSAGNPLQSTIVQNVTVTPLNPDPFWADAGLVLTKAPTTSSSTDGEVTMKGTAVAPAGGQFPVAQLQARIIGKKATFSNGRRQLVSGKDAFFNYDSATATTWTSRFIGLTQNDINIIKAEGQARAMWRDDPVNPTTTTTFESSGAIPGPNAPCSSTSP